MGATGAEKTNRIGKNHKTLTDLSTQYDVRAESPKFWTRRRKGRKLQMASFEVGRRKLPISALAPLARALTVTLEELVEQVAEKPKGKRGSVPKLQQQLDTISALPKPQQRFVMQVLDTVLAQASR